MKCPTCGAPLGSVQFDIAADPLRVYYRGQLIALSAFQSQILAKLIRQGRVHAERLHQSRYSLYQIVSAMRKQLPEGLHIDVVRGWGYELRVDP